MNRSSQFRFVLEWIVPAVIGLAVGVVLWNLAHGLGGGGATLGPGLLSLAVILLWSRRRTRS